MAGQHEPLGQLGHSREGLLCFHSGLAVQGVRVEALTIYSVLSKAYILLPTTQYPKETSCYEFLSTKTKVSQAQSTSSFNYPLENHHK